MSMQDRMDLESEFQALVNEMYQSIHNKQTAGRITFDQAQELRQMVHDRVISTEKDTGSWCASEYDTDETWDDGWSPSRCW